jgi:phosphonate transport system permease protein
VRAGTRRAVLAAILAAGVSAFLYLDLDLASLLPGRAALTVAGRFFASAFTPALRFEGDFAGDGPFPVLLKALGAARLTVVFAAAAASLSLVFGLVLGFLGSTAWWSFAPAGGRSAARRTLARTIAPAVYAGVRGVIALMRSVHELLWAVLFLAAFGLNNLSAVIAIAIPYSGTFAKVFSEMIDEAPRDSADALQGLGASHLQVFLFGVLPRALPDMAAYAFYRFECALRSSAILGFFGYPTLGYYIAISFENLHYAEVWTYLYTLFLMVAVTDWWSGAMRRRMVA